ncbi:hypothetical protein F2P81_011616 [Scophthalmus maximus]|uniref:Uncharacterized protein n=1 Tax=Scophthalmus maximus TaxID=52904 RepID=A0A6A4SZ34_SCOMX|nr:hypothetical protein F2P81_011616 [Scophthalmus maximus]
MLASHVANLSIHEDVNSCEENNAVHLAFFNSNPRGPPTPPGSSGPATTRRRSDKSHGEQLTEISPRRGPSIRAPL